ncbi:hypothetical protein KIK06_24960 [Nocardiopsis sp. EMB25]|uniref:hypothetical protein n=1 Tax=Nocardiopsis sp. EMB25 TaxID=2835867 RepID=UPI00228523CC|nr:hypothetical protein [Nocardiopsis sp. EMB25]MCY9787140.1 hypothetical protein [Nocardiopsis sp. EMB25]
MTRTESMQWNRAVMQSSLDCPEQNGSFDLEQVSPDLLAEVQASIAAEVGKAKS